MAGNYAVFSVKIVQLVNRDPERERLSSVSRIHIYFLNITMWFMSQLNNCENTTQQSGMDASAYLREEVCVF